MISKDYVVQDKKYVQTFVEPKVFKFKEVLNVTELPERKEVLDPILKPLTPQTKKIVREYPLNPVKYVNQPVIEPIIEKQSLKVNYVDEKDNV